MGMEISSNYSKTAVETGSGETSAKSTTETKKEENVKQTGQAAVYEKAATENTDSTKQIYSKENRAELVKKLKAEAAERQQRLVQLVADSLNGQKLKGDIAKLFNGESNGVGLKSIFESLDVDQATIEQAQKDIAEDGYWGVEQTSDRLVDMAKALSGGDSSKADLMIESVKKGFEQATKAWGDDLPDISRRTLDATIEKLNQWKDGTEVVEKA